MDIGDRSVGAFVAAARGRGGLDAGEAGNGGVVPVFNEHALGDIAVSSGIVVATATMIYMFYWIWSLWAAATSEGDRAVGSPGSAGKGNEQRLSLG